MTIDLSALPVTFTWVGSKAFLRRGPLRVSVIHIEGGMACPAEVWTKLEGASAKSLGGGRYEVLGMTVRVQPYLVPSYGCSESWEPGPLASLKAVA